MRWWLVCLALAGCDHGKSPCAGEQTDNLETPNSDAALQFQIDKCRADTTACHDLCGLILMRTHPSGVMQTGCNVTFHVDHVEVKYRYGCLGGGPDGGIDQFDGPVGFIDALRTSMVDAP
jgi:hypothetical protein